MSTVEDQVLAALDFPTPCGCGNPAAWVAVITCCGRSELRCDLCRKTLSKFFRRVRRSGAWDHPDCGATISRRVTVLWRVMAR